MNTFFKYPPPVLEYFFYRVFKNAYLKTSTYLCFEYKKYILQEMSATIVIINR